MTTQEQQAQAFTVHVDLATYRRLKLQALEERRPMSRIIRESIRNYLDLAAPVTNGEKK